MSLLFITYSISPTIYVNKHLSCLTFGGVPTEKSYPTVTRKRRILLGHLLLQITGGFLAYDKGKPQKSDQLP